MFKFILVVSALVAVAFAAPQTPANSWRIVGGEKAAEGQFPYIISLRYFGSHRCGGSILDEDTILTAAHCVVGISATSLQVVVGSNQLNGGGRGYSVVKAVSHKEYDSYKITNDVAIVKVQGPIEFNDRVQPIELETENVDEEREAVLCGWGTTTYPGSAPNDLQFIELKTVPYQDCKERHGSNPVFESQVCTFTKRNQGACHGDSGGPLTNVNGKQIGIVSWGIPCGAGYPDVFTRVSSFIDWINANK